MVAIIEREELLNDLGFMVMTFKMPKTTGHCAICNMRLTAYFPKDYPDEWKFCCICLEMANKIINGTLIKYSWMDYRIKKILKIITIVG